MYGPHVKTRDNSLWEEHARRKETWSCYVSLRRRSRSLVRPECLTNEGDSDAATDSVKEINGKEALVPNPICVLRI